MESKEKQPRNNSAALGQGPGSTLRDTRRNVFKTLCKIKTQQMEDAPFSIAKNTT